MSILIWDDCDPPELDKKYNHTVVLWCGYITKDFPNAVSMPQWVEDHADSIRQRYLSWIYEIGQTQIHGRSVIQHLELRPGFSSWWMSLLAEKCNFAKSPHIDDAIKLIAFVDWMDSQDFEHVVLLSSRDKLAQCLGQWCDQKGIEFEWQRNSPKNIVVPSLSRRVYNKLPHFLQAAIWLTRQIFYRWRLRRVGVPQWYETQGKITFVSYLFNLVPDKAEQGIFESRYWGTLPETLCKQGIKTNWLHIYFEHEFLPSAKHAAQQICDFNRMAGSLQNHVTLDSFLSLKLIGKTLLDWFYLLRQGATTPLHNYIPELNGINLWPLFRDDWKSSTFGKTSIANTLHLNLFEKAFGLLPKQFLGIYLQENMDWEYASIYSWRHQLHGQLIGCPHSTVRFWDLRYFFDTQIYDAAGQNSMPMPDLVAVNGPAARQIYLNGGYPEDRLIEVEALRYLYLNRKPEGDRKITSQTTPTIGKLVTSPLKLLVLGGYTEVNNQLQMQLLSEIAPDLPVETIITIKPHPANPIQPQDYPSLTFAVTASPLGELLKDADIAYSGPITSAAVDAYCYGLPVISVLDPTVLNMSPLRGCKGVTFISTPSELVNAIKSAATHIPRNDQSKQFFHLDEDLPRWRSVTGG